MQHDRWNYINPRKKIIKNKRQKNAMAGSFIYHSKPKHGKKKKKKKKEIEGDLTHMLWQPSTK